MMLSLAYDYENLRKRLSDIGYDGSHVDDDRICEALVSVAVSLEEYGLSNNEKDVVMELLSSEGRKNLNEYTKKENKEWRNFDYGNVSKGDYVRVKKDAYTSETGVKHNGLVGILIAMSGGKCTVRYIGLAAGETMKHPMDNLESLKIR